MFQARMAGAEKAYFEEMGIDPPNSTARQGLGDSRQNWPEGTCTTQGVKSSCAVTYTVTVSFSCSSLLSLAVIFMCYTWDSRMQYQQNQNLITGNNTSVRKTMYSITISNMNDIHLVLPVNLPNTIWYLVHGYLGILGNTIQVRSAV